MATSNDQIQPVPASPSVNPDTQALPEYPSMSRIQRIDAVGPTASNRQERSLERRTDTLAARVNALIQAHNLNADPLTATFLRLVGGVANRMQGSLWLPVLNTLVADVAPRADQALTTAGLNTAALNANGQEITNVAPATGPNSAVTLGQMGGAFSLIAATVDQSVGVTLTPYGGGYTFVVPSGITSITVRLRSGGGGGGGGGGWATAHDAPDNATAGGATTVTDFTDSIVLLNLPGGGRGGPGQGDDTGAAGFGGAAPSSISVGAGVTVLDTQGGAAGSPGGVGTVSTGGNGGTLGGGRGGDAGIIGDGAGGGGGGGGWYVLARIPVTPGHVILVDAGNPGYGGDGSSGGGAVGSDGTSGTASVYFGLLAASQI